MNFINISHIKTTNWNLTGQYIEDSFIINDMEKNKKHVS